MEAVPRMPMLAFELKHCSEHDEFTSKLKTYIEDFYSENPENYNKECQELEQLCQTVVNIPHDFTGCSTLKKYFCQLQFLQSRFPMEEGGILAMPFTWECVYTGKSVTIADIKFEQACVLYNVGALHSILGALDNRQSPEGMKVSCTHFQCAAWAFQHVKDTFQAGMTPDLTFDLLSFQTILMLAQSQECILEKSMSDNRKSTITAKIACQIVDYYREAGKHLDSKECAVIGSKRLKDWRRRLEMKVSYHQAITYYYLGSESVDRQKWGEAVTYLQEAQTKLVEAGKIAKSDEHEDIETVLTFANDVMAGKYSSVKKDNDFVYHEKVPELESLPELKGASLVKGIPFDPTDQNISGPDIFRRLVPMEAHQASSVYSEVKANLLRSVTGRIEEKDGVLQEYLSSLQLEASNLFPEGPTRLPQELLEKCAAISVKPGAIQDLIDAMQSLSTIATDTEGNISEIFNLLETEVAAEKEFQEKYGKRGHNVTLDEIAKECSKYKEGIQTSSQSNQDLHKAMGTHISNLKLLSSSLDEIQKSLPSPEQHKTPEDEEVIVEMRRLMEKVEEMKTQRKTLEEKLRKDIHADDVTTALVTREGSSQEEFFESQLQKHDGQIDLIDKNLTAQTNILKALTECNAKYARIRKLLKDCEQRREAMIVDLKTSYDVYEELLAKTQKGIEFYKKLEENVQRLLERTQRVYKVQEEEREQILMRLKPKAPPPSRPSAPKPGGPGAGAANPPPVTMATGLDHPTQVPPGLQDPSGFAVPGLNPAAMAKMGGPPQVEQPLKLKDFLPFMKPKTFGPDRGKPANEIPGLPGDSLPASQSGSPLHVSGSPASQPAHMGELRLDGGRLPTSVHDDMVPDPSMSVTQQPPQQPAAAQQPQLQPHQQDVARDMAHIRPVIPSQQRGEMPPYPVNHPPVVLQQPPPVSGQQVGGLAGGMSVQSPTAPPGAPSARPHVPLPTQSTQPPGGPQATGQGQQRRHTPSPVGAPSASSQPSVQTTTDLQHGYTQLQYGAMGQPMYSGQPLPPQEVYRGLPGQQQQGLPQQQQQGLPKQQQQGLPQHQQGLPQQHQGLPQQQQGLPQQQQGLPQQQQGLPQQQQGLPQQQQGLPQQARGLPEQQQKLLPRQQHGLPQQPVLPQPQTLPDQAQVLPGHQQVLPQQQQTLPGQQQALPGQPQVLPGQHQPVSSTAGGATPQRVQTGIMPGGGSGPGTRLTTDQQTGGPPSHMPIYNGHGMSPPPPGGGHHQNAASSVAQQMYHLGQQTTGMNLQTGPLQGQTRYPEISVAQSVSSQRPGTASSQHGQPAPSQAMMGMPASSQPQMNYPPRSLPTQGLSTVNQNYPQHQVTTSLTPGLTNQRLIHPQALPGHMGYGGQSIGGGHIHAGPANVALSSQNAQPQSLNTSYSQGVVSSQVTSAQSHVAQNMNQATPLAVEVPGLNPQPSHYQPISSQNTSQPPQIMPNTATSVHPGQIPSDVHGQQPARQNYAMSHQNVDNRQHPVGPPQVHPGSSGSVPPTQPYYQGGQYSQGNQPQVPQQQQQQQQPHQVTSSVGAGMPGTQIPRHYQGSPQTVPTGKHQPSGVRHPGPAQNVGPSIPVSQTPGMPMHQSNMPPHPQQNVRLPQGQNLQGQYVTPQAQGQFTPGAPSGPGQGYMQPHQGQRPMMAPHGQGQPIYQGQGQTVNQGYQLPQPGQLQGQRPTMLPPQGQGQGRGQQLPHPGQAQVQGQSPVLPPQDQGQGNVMMSGAQGHVLPNQTQRLQHPYAQPPPNNTQMNPAPLPAGSQFTQQVGPGQQQQQDLLMTQMSCFVTPQAPTLTPGILQPSNIGSGGLSMSPVGGGTPNSSTPTDTPRPTPSQTPQPALQQQPEHQGSRGSPQRQLQPIVNNQNLPLKPTMSHVPVRREDSGASTTSLDDILSSSPRNIQISSPSSKENVLRPRVVTEEEQEKQREEQMKTSLTLHRDPYSDGESLKKFVSEVEGYVKHVEGLTKHTLSGPTPLDKEWRDLAEHQERETRGLSMAIARCYPMKNRSPDVMPYDATRVVLKMGQDDYVNASHIKEVASTCPSFIAAQSPLPSTFVDFWQMVYEEGTEVIVMLNSVSEPGMQKSHIYWPEDKTRPSHQGHFQLHLQSERRKKFWVERIINLSHKQTRHTRSVIHLQFDSWFPSGQPESPAQLIQFVSDVHSCYVQQRSLLKPVLVHCSDGIGRTGAFIVIYTAVQEVDHGRGIVDICDVIKRLRLQRKWMVREKEQMKFCYETALYHAQDILMKRGILVNKASFEDKPGSKTNHIHTPTEDFIFGSPVPLSAIQSTVAKMTLKERQAPDGGEQTPSHTTSSSIHPTPSEHSNPQSPHHSKHYQQQPIPPLQPHSASSSPQILHRHQQPMTQQNVTWSMSAPTQHPVMSSPQEQDAMMANQQPLQQQREGLGVSQNGLNSRNGTQVIQANQQPSTSSSSGSDVVMTDTQQSSAHNASPLSLADLQNPQTFNLGSPSTPPNKRRVTKATFESHTTSMAQKTSEEEGDPLSMLDPLWTTKK